MSFVKFILFVFILFGYSNANDNKVVIEEFASYTCSYCKKFSDDIYPQIEKDFLKKYKNKIVFEYKHFPLDNLAMKIALVSECVPNSRKTNFHKIIYKNQAKIFGQQGDFWLKDTVKYFGINAKKYKRCIADNKSYKKILKNMEIYKKKYNVSGTPTLIIDGARVSAFDYPLIKKKIEDGLRKN